MILTGLSNFITIASCFLVYANQPAETKVKVACISNADLMGGKRTERIAGEFAVDTFFKKVDIYIGFKRPFLGIDEEQMTNTKCTVSSNGALVDTKNGNVATHIVLIEDTFIPGERISVVIKNHLGDKRELSLIPRKITAASEDKNWGLDVEALEWNIFAITVSGIEPGELIQLRAFSGNEVIKAEHKVHPNIPIMVFPAVNGKSGGISIVRIEREDGRNLEVYIPWGTELKKYSRV